MCKLYERIDEIPMPSYERLAAKAHLVRAEAIAELIVAAIRKVQSLAHAARELATWPTHRAS
jgi:hypothetical protein